jgi:hypothetical protein
MKFPGKTIIHIIEAALVAVLVFWFVWKDPLKIFSSSQIYMAQTPLDVKNICSIGQMVTAEYYGEVIASLPESKLSFDHAFYEETFANLYDTIITVVYRTDSLVKTLKKPWLKGKFSFFYQYYHELNSGLTSNIFYYPVMVHLDSLYEYNVFHKPDNFKKNQDYSDDIEDYEKPVIRKLWDNITANAEPYRIGTSNFEKTYVKYIKRSPFKNERKKEILVLGRGWVKAGLDFGTVNSYNFKYLKDQGIIHFYKIQPKILFNDINPWLVPNKIPGFEFVKISGRATNPDDIASVKRECVEKLTQKAVDSHILEKARENAEKNLKSFFSLLTGTEIKQVKFIVSKYDAYRDVFSRDIWNSSEYLSFDTIWQKDLKALDTAWYTNMTVQRNELDSFFRQMVGAKKVRSKNKELLPLTKYTATALKIMADNKVDTSEVKRINLLFKEEIVGNSFSGIDSFWYHKPQKRTDDFYGVFRTVINPSKPPAGIDTLLLKRLKTGRF